MGVAVADVAAAARHAFEPLRVVDPCRLPELDVDAALAHARAAHAREVGLAAGLHGKARVQQVVPAFHSRMRSVSIALMKSDSALGGGHEDLLGADAVHLGDGEVRQLIVRAVVTRLELELRDDAVAIGVDRGERFRQQPALRLRAASSRPSVLASSCCEQPRGRAPRDRSAGRWPSARSR